MAAELPDQDIPYPDNEEHRLTQARDRLGVVLQKFINESRNAPTRNSKGKPLADDILGEANDAFNNLKNWAVDLKRPDEPQKKNEIIDCMVLIANLVTNPVLKQELDKIIEEARKEHKEFDAAYRDYLQHISHSGIIRPLTSSTGHLVTVDMQNRIAHGPRGPGGFEAAIAMGKTTEIFKEFDMVETHPAPSMERLANSDMTGWAQRKKTSQEIILLLKANLLPSKTMNIALPFLTKGQQAEIAKELEAYNKRAHDHQEKKSQRIAGTQSTPVTPAPDLTATTTSKSGPTMKADTPDAASPSTTHRPGPGSSTH